MKKIISFIIIAIFIAITILPSCKKNDLEQEYQDYSVAYLLRNKIDRDRRFIITYKDPAFANKITEQYESIRDTFWIRLEAKTLDIMYMSAISTNDTVDFDVSIYVNNELVARDSTICFWQCDTTRAVVEYPLP